MICWRFPLSLILDLVNKAFLFQQCSLDVECSIDESVRSFSQQSQSFPLLEKKSSEKLHFSFFASKRSSGDVGSFYDNPSGSSRLKASEHFVWIPTRKTSLAENISFFQWKFTRTRRMQSLQVRQKKFANISTFSVSRCDENEGKQVLQEF